MFTENTVLTKIIQTSLSSLLLIFVLVSCSDRNNSSNNTSPNTKETGNKNTDNHKGETSTKTPVITPPINVVLNSFPSDGAIDVKLDATISATFNIDLINNSITKDSFYLTDQSNIVVPTVVSYATLTKTASLKPLNKLHTYKQYTVNMTNSITDLSGNGIGTKSWRFSTRDGRWAMTSSQLSNPGAYPENATIAVNNDGTAIAVWTQLNFTQKAILTSHFSPLKGWSIPHQIAENINTYMMPDVSMDSNGNALVVWSQNDETNNKTRIAASYFSFNKISSIGIWGNTKLINNNASAYNPQVSFDTDGNAIVVWKELGKNDYDIWANYYDATKTNSWATPKLLEQLPGSTSDPKIAFDKNNNAIVVWVQTTGFGMQSPPGDTTIQSIFYTAKGNSFDQSWGKSTVITSLYTSNTGSFNDVQVTSDANNNFHVIWTTRQTVNFANSFPQQTPPNQPSQATPPMPSTQPFPPPNQQIDRFSKFIQTRLYTNSTANWSPVTTISSGIDSRRAAIASDGLGNVIAIWLEGISNETTLWTNRFSNNTWSTAKILKTNIISLQMAETPQLAIDDRGNALALWSGYNTNRMRISSSHYHIDTDTWDNFLNIDNYSKVIPGQSSSFGKIAMTGNGSAFAIWLFSDGNTGTKYLHSIRFE